MKVIPPPLFNRISNLKEKTNLEPLNYSELLTFLLSAEGSLIYNIEMGGSNIWEYKELESLVDTLLSINIRSVLLTTIDSLINKYNYKTQEIIKKSLFVKLYVKFDTLDKFEKLLQMDIDLSKFHINFIVYNEDEYKIFLEWLKTHPIKKKWFIPIYLENSKFLEENITFEKTEIFQQKQTINEILVKEMINTFRFGKLTISSTGKVFANVNSSSVGNIKTLRLTDIIFEALYDQNSWRQTRVNVVPCKYCLYKLICPPISNYETVLKKYNLCKMKGKYDESEK